jgi:hypothetical protein
MTNNNKNNYDRKASPLSTSTISLLARDIRQLALDMRTRPAEEEMLLALLQGGDAWAAVRRHRSCCDQMHHFSPLLDIFLSKEDHCHCINNLSGETKTESKLLVMTFCQ